MKIFPGSCLRMWRKKEDLLTLDQVQMHTVPSTWGFAFGNALYPCLPFELTEPWTAAAGQKKRLSGADGGKPGLAASGLQTVLSSACEGWRRRTIRQDGLVEWPSTRANKTVLCFSALFQLFDRRKIALIQNPFGASLWSQLLFTKSCYSLNSMVFLWSSFLDIISSCLWCYKSGCTQGQKYPSRWLPEFSLQQSTGSARPGHTSNHKL